LAQSESISTQLGIAYKNKAGCGGKMATGFRDPLGDGTITVEQDAADQVSALRVFMQPDLDNGDTLGERHLGTDWNATRDVDELAYAEPRRVCRRLICLSYAAMSDLSRAA